MEQIRKISKEQIIMAFVATCIEATARLTDSNYIDVYNRMKNVNLIENYIVRDTRLKFEYEVGYQLPAF